MDVVLLIMLLPLGTLFYVFCFALCHVIISCFIFFYYSFFSFLVLYVLFSILCVLCCFVLGIVSSLVYSCVFSTCVQVYRPLPPGGNPIAVNKYHTIFHILQVQSVGLTVLKTMRYIVKEESNILHTIKRRKAD